MCPAIMLAYPMLVYPMMSSAFAPPTGVSTGLANVEASESNLVNVIYFLAFGGLAVAAALPRLDFGRRIPWTSATAAIAAYLLLALLSVGWALEPAISFRRLIQQDLIVFTALFAGIAEPDPRRIVRMLANLMIVVVGINVVWLGVKPPSPIGVEGIYPQKNLLGAAMLVCLPILIFEALTSRARRRVICAACVFAALLLLVVSQSKTSLGIALVVPTTVVGALVAARTIRVPASWLLLFGLFVLSLLALLAGQVAGLTMDMVSLVLFDDTTFTGRTYIWDFVRSQAELRPTLGYGFNSFWAVGFDSPSFQSAPGFVVSLLQAHNGYLDVRLETGYVGFALLFVVIVAAVVQSSRAGLRRDPLLVWLAMTLVLTAALHNCLESSFFRGFQLMWMAFLTAVGLTAPRLFAAAAAAARGSRTRPTRPSAVFPVAADPARVR